VEKLRQKRAGASRKQGHAKPSNQVSAYMDGKKLSVAVYQRDQLQAGMRLQSPCIVTEYSSTTLIPPGARATMDSYGNLIIEAGT
jgi:N-methylhydantoinase A